MQQIKIKLLMQNTSKILKGPILSSYWPEQFEEQMSNWEMQSINFWFLHFCFTEQIGHLQNPYKTKY
jgi:hypothetical protein